MGFIRELHGKKEIKYYINNFKKYFKRNEYLKFDKERREVVLN